MTTRSKTIAIGIIVVIAGAILLLTGTGKEESFVASTTMRVTSPAFGQDQSIPVQYACDGDNISPPLTFSGVPADAKSLVLIVDDPDAVGGDWVHWVVTDIQPATAEIAEDTVPSGALETMTDFGRPWYGGPCPRSGTHRYQFKLYALDTKLDLDPDAVKADVENAMDGRILEQAMLVGLYARQ